MRRITIKPGAVTLAEWRAIHDGAGVSLDPASHAAIDRSAAAIATILAKGEPVYGINTGFGKLAMVRIADADLATLQRQYRVVPCRRHRRAHAGRGGSAHDGAEAREPRARGFRVTRATVAMLETLLDRGITPIVPQQGSVGASGDLAPLSHMTAAMIGVGAFIVEGQTVPAGAALAAAGLTPLQLARRKGSPC